jgi:ABC-type nitrate/sulfonate/bicarbonate transport system permease component
VVIWQLVTVAVNDPVFLPTVAQTVSSFAHYFSRPYPTQGSPLWFDTLISLSRILIGFAIGTVAGVTLGAAMSASKVARHLTDRSWRSWRNHRRRAQRRPRRLCARTLGTTARYTMLHVQIRSALPGIITGVRIAMAGSWTSIVAAELIAATSGLG